MRKVWDVDKDTTKLLCGLGCACHAFSCIWPRTRAEVLGFHMGEMLRGAPIGWVVPVWQLLTSPMVTSATVSVVPVFGNNRECLHPALSVKWADQPVGNKKETASEHL